MLAVGRALVRQPTVLLLDEPSLGLAPLLVQQILDTVTSLAQRNVAVILSEQNAAAALRVADVGIVLDNGRVARVDQADVLLQDEDVSQHYLGGFGRRSEESSSTSALPDALRKRTLLT